eukprot:CAMPEP_0185570288 /NCGR_PEP_ID=MMETSP0434-20130131/2657_1 /TAXON_ID=626734 ORGANISM="Favella taraikaensis, Strain Fe Narragansett Bay" /NCGR_SAMPLE_ID=MMETSP0434 /ASSEMBLY_ACC=CAM_ASM_000379 /LENGTH=83 /DNA_ID=CAMNT_0028185369 /DNA_START=627 /DNA_END=878 /DNA_ORIENTATION=-
MARKSNQLLPRPRFLRKEKLVQASLAKTSDSEQTSQQSQTWQKATTKPYKKTQWNLWSSCQQEVMTLPGTYKYTPLETNQESV